MCIGAAWNLPEKTTERRVHGEKVPNIVDLTPKHQKLPQPRVLEWRVEATRNYPDGGVEPEHDGEFHGEACARGGGPKHHSSTSKDAEKPISHVCAAAIHRIDING
jgi:hypothetical protein